MALLLAWLGAFTGCDPQDPFPLPCDEQETAYLSGELATMNYREGSNWMLLDSLNDVMDTLVVTRFEHGFLSKNGCENHLTEFYRYEIHCSHHQRTDEYMLTPKGLVRNPDHLMEGETIFYGTTPGSRKPDHVTTYLELPIGQDSYQHVSKCRVENDPNEQNRNTEYYVNAEFGFLRIALFDEYGEMISNKVILRREIFR